VGSDSCVIEKKIGGEGGLGETPFSWGLGSFWGLYRVTKGGKVAQGAEREGAAKEKRAVGPFA